MSETDTTDTETTAEPGDAAEPTAEAWQALGAGTAAAEFTDSFRPPTPDGTDEQQPTDTGADEADNDGDGGDDSEGNPTDREAAKWRKKLRAAEAEKAEIATRLEAMQRSTVDAHVTALGMKPAALWAAGTELGDLLGDDGVPDPEKVDTAAAAAKETLGVQTYKPRPLRGYQSGAMATQPKRNSWTQAFAPKDSD
ncbi:hypothetical protein [Mycobacterium paraintracellulare]|uniref:hypothetical protein n=1 Tax=Mycobacterium paraintracellulare TaxID=1138383 RepID=UPI001914F2A1|nr:hypothetical protein [Mycobacterium paraintracellulare]BCP06110.1 hypothetical protein MINTM019_35660 [Mycobacterium paraintracellulare]